MKKAGSGEKRGSVFFPVLIILALAFVLTSGVLGFILGSNAAGNAAGRLIDTIILSPVSVESGVDEITHFLSGQVRKSSGEVFSYAPVKLNDRAEKQADENGKFLFADIRSGSHQLRVMDGEKVLASMTLVLDFSEEGDMHADVSVPDEPELTVPSRVRMVELAFIVEEDKIKLDEDLSSVITAEGEIVTFESKKLRLKEDSYAVTSNGNVVAFSGHILFPSNGDVISPAGVMEKQSTSAARVPGLLTEPETGNIATENGITIEQDGSVRTKEDILVSPGPAIILIEEETVEEVITPPEEYIPLRTPPEEEEQGSSGGDVPEDSGMPPDDENGDPDVSSGPEDDGLEIISAETGISWRQQSTIDLFKNQTNQVYLKNQRSDIPTIAPGSDVFYVFILKNNNDFAIEYDIMISEESFHLPMYFSLYNDRNNKLYSYRAKMQPTDGVITPRIVIEGNSQITFRIEWKWEYEDRYQPTIDNAYDMAATMETQPYIVSLMIYAEQIIEKSDEPDEGIRYPGQKPEYK